MSKNCNTSRCEICGKFISLKDEQDKRKVKWNQTFDANWDSDCCGYVPEYYSLPCHIKCINKLIKHHE